jgi:S-adenosylmethionine decarboxylase
MEKVLHFGEHLTIDGYGGNSEKLNDSDLVLMCLTKLPSQLGMHLLSKAEVFSAPDNGLKDPGGWSGFVVIAESHISLHTFPKRGFISADVYTCKNGMDIELIKNFFIAQFELKNLEINFIKRGTKYPAQNIY